MSLGIQSCERGGMVRDGRRSARAPFRLCGVIAVLSALLLTGCGGGGGGNASSGSGSSSTSAATAATVQATGSNVATVTGTIDDATTGNTATSKVVVTFGSYYTVTGASGTFSLQIPANAAGTLKIYGLAEYNTSTGYLILGSNGLPESSGYIQDAGTVGSSTGVSLNATGISIPATAAGGTVALGTIYIYDNSGPPAPPNI